MWHIISIRYRTEWRGSQKFYEEHPEGPGLGQDRVCKQRFRMEDIYCDSPGTSEHCQLSLWSPLLERKQKKKTNVIVFEYIHFLCILVFKCSIVLTTKINVKLSAFCPHSF